VLCGVFGGKNGKLLVTGGEDGNVKIWSLKQMICLFTFSSDHPNLFHQSSISSLTIHPSNDEMRCLSAGDDGISFLFHITSHKILASFPHSQQQEEEISKNEENENDQEENEKSLLLPLTQFSFI